MYRDANGTTLRRSVVIERASSHFKAIQKNHQNNIITLTQQHTQHAKPKSSTTITSRQHRRPISERRHSRRRDARSETSIGRTLRFDRPMCAPSCRQKTQHYSKLRAIVTRFHFSLLLMCVCVVVVVVCLFVYQINVFGCSCASMIVEPLSAPTTNLQKRKFRSISKIHLHPFVQKNNKLY
jgi:hypothetical protein